MDKFFRPFRVRNALHILGQIFTPDTTEVTIVELNAAGYILRAYGTTVPTDAEANYAKGCLFFDTNASAGSIIFINEGDHTSCDFNSTSISGGDVSAVNTDGVSMLGGGTSGSITLASGITVKNATGGTLAKGTLVRVSGYSGGYLITKADADAGLAATHILTADILDTASGSAYSVAVVTNIATDTAGAVGDPVYLSATAGEYTFTAPTGADQIAQRVGVVVTKHALTGSILFFAGVIEKFGSSSLQANATVKTEARTATADGLTTGIISAGVTHVTVTSADANHIVVLPTPVVGQTITLDVGATGFELRSSTPASIAINGGTGASAESAIPANSTLYMVCVSATAWKGFYMDADGDLAKVEAAA